MVVIAAWFLMRTQPGSKATSSRKHYAPLNHITGE
jgi:hypothetical protein